MTNEFKQKLDTILARLKDEVVQLRTGRASPSLVEDIEVEYYGSGNLLKTLAFISSPDPRQIIIRPFDKNAIQPIEKAIQSSRLGLNPVTEKDLIRVSIPPLTEERRRELAKILGKHLEEARIQVRRSREDELREIDRMAKTKEISEDEKFRRKNEIQKIVDEVNKKIEDMGKVKEKEIMTV